MNGISLKQQLFMSVFGVYLISVAPLTWALTVSADNSTLTMQHPGVGDPDSALDVLDNGTTMESGDNHFNEDVDLSTDTDADIDDDISIDGGQSQISADIDKD